MSSKPLVAIFTNHDNDVYCFRLEMIQTLISSGFDVLISCPDGKRFELLDQKYGLKKNRDFLYDEPQINRRSMNPLQDGKLFFHYYHLLKKTRPAVVLTYTPKPNAYAGIAAHMLRIPTIISMTGLGSITRMDGIKRHLILALYRISYRNSEMVMFQNSENMQFAIENGFVGGKCRLLPGSGAALNRFPLQDYPEGGNGSSGETVVFNFIGRVFGEKGIDDYIECARRIKSKYPRTEFNVIGLIESTDAQYRQKLENYDASRIGVIYRGFQDDILPWIRRSHVTIHPSNYGEGMSNVLMESASCGRPIITTDNPGCRETVIDGVSGFLFPGGDIERLISIVEKFLVDMSNDERRQMGLEGRRKMEHEFDRRKVAEAYLECIWELL